MSGFDLLDVVDVKFPWLQSKVRGLVSDAVVDGGYIRVVFKDTSDGFPCRPDECKLVSDDELFGGDGGKQN